MQRSNFDMERGEKLRGECEVPDLLFPRRTAWSMVFISWFSVSPGIGFSCLNLLVIHTAAVKASSVCSLHRQSLAEVGDSRTGDGRCGPHGAVLKVNCCNKDVFPPPLQQVPLFMDLYPNLGAAVLPNHEETHFI